MSLAIAIGIGPTMTNRAGWSLTSLGASLLAWWDSSYGVSLSTNKVTAWADRVAGYSATQETDAARPTYSATDYNGAPGLTFDGSDDHLTLASQPFPSGAVAGEIWAVATQEALPGDVASRLLVSYGGDASTARRSLTRGVQTGTNRLLVQTGDGVGNVSQTHTGVDYSGSHLVRGIFSPTTITPQVDENLFTGTAAVSATGTSRLRIGAISNTAAGNYWSGKIRDVIITGPLTADQAAALTAWALPRRML